MASSRPPEHYCFGTFELQPEKRRLLKNGATILLRPRAFDLLAALVDRAGHLVTKDELLEQVWPKMVVEEAALHVQVSALRKVVGSDAITTVSGRGYQFTLPVTKGDDQGDRASEPRHNLPYQLTSFIGREQEIAQLGELVTTNRLVTLTGAGGVGKTRLAIEVASRAVGAFADGAWLVELAALSDPRLVPQAVAKVLDVREQAARTAIETLSEYLASRKLLLVLDNVEHLLDACVHLVGEIIHRTPWVTLLVTSRERLGMTGELTYRVPSLTVPGSSETYAVEATIQYEGVRLFVERAKLVRPHFELTASNASSVASVCAQLDGMPLAIELAAARLRSMSVDELGERLVQRFALLTDGSRAALPRHRTLRSMLDWSYDLLTAREQAMLRRVAVFVGGWTLASAEQVCSGGDVNALTVVELLASLVDKSWVMTDEQAGGSRYRMLETVRHYALDRLRDSDEEARWRASHVACYLALAKEFFAGVAGPEQQAWFSRIECEHENLRAALAWSAKSSPVEGLRLAVASAAFWRIRGHLEEGRQWLARLLEAFPIDGLARERARGLHAAATLAISQGDYVAAKGLLQECLATYRATNDQEAASRALQSLAYLSLCQRQYAEAEALAREAINCARATGNRRLLYPNLSTLAVSVHRQGKWTEARELHEQALGVARELGTPFEMGHALNEIGRAACDEGRHGLALQHTAEAMNILHRLGNRPGVIDSLEALADVAAATAAPQRAARLWGAADALRQEIGSARRGDEATDWEQHIKPVRATLTSDDFDQAWNEGRAMSCNDAVRYALNEQTGRDT